ncbi:hypothetical protein B566_EDAN001367 [Ephemera danica]|nr:hypothetical protein B566_EDAN001367 [Ephemera danica]
MFDMKFEVWLLFCACVALSSAAAPENHRPAHRPRLSSRLIPSRTPTTTAAPKVTAAASTTAVTVTTAEPSTTEAPVEERNPQVSDISTQVLAQQHQQQLALDALKTTPQPATFATTQFGGVIQSATQNDLQQLLNLMNQAANQYQFPAPTFSPQSSFGPSGVGGASNFYGQGGGYGQQNIFGGNDAYNQYNPNQFQSSQYSPYQQNLYSNPNTYNSPNSYSAPPNPYSQPNPYAQPNIFGQQNPYPQQNAYTQAPPTQRYNYQLPNSVPLPYNPPPTPTFVFKDGQYHIQGNSGQLQPIQIPTVSTPVETPNVVTKSEPAAPVIAAPEPQSETPQTAGVQYVVTSSQQQTQQNTIQPQVQYVQEPQQQVQYTQQPQQVQYTQQPQPQVQYTQQPQQVQYTQQPQPQVQYAQQPQQQIQYAQQYATSHQTPATSYVQQSQPVYSQQPLVQHIPPEQVTAQPQPSQGAHSFFQEQVVQSVSQSVEPATVQAKPSQMFPSICGAIEQASSHSVYILIRCNKSIDVEKGKRQHNLEL